MCTLNIVQEARQLRKRGVGLRRRKKWRNAESKKGGKKRDNKSAVNESQPALQTHKQLSWRVTEFLQTRTAQGYKEKGEEEEKKKGKKRERRGVDKQNCLFR